MPDQPNSTSARLLVPLAIAVTAVVVLILLASTLGGGGGGDGAQGADPARDQPRRATKKQEDPKTETASRSEGRSATYSVKAGDTPGSIAGEVGITVDRLLELNPDLDPNSLVAGQKIKLRE